MRDRQGLVEGWPLVGVIAVGLGLMVAVLLPMAHDLVDGLRLVIRATARSSLLLFLLAFTASAVGRLSRAPLAAWLRRNRRQMGVGFAISHLLHLGAIVWLARLDPILFASLTTPASFLFGGLGYLLIVAMLATSFDATARVIGVRGWSSLHRTGLWYIWLMFVINFGKRIPESPSYTFAVALALLALGVRIRAGRATGSPAAT
jgi:methionine sulfoxide reductase heme-binding subunit